MQVDRYIIIYSDTDSIVYSLYIEDAYEWIKERRENFDLSDSLREDMKDNTNKKVPCKVKDEMNTLVIKEFTAVAPKSYSCVKATLEEMACSYPHLYKYYENAKGKILTEINGKKLYKAFLR